MPVEIGEPGLRGTVLEPNPDHRNPRPVPELEENREYRLLAELIPNLAWIAQADGSIYWFNHRWFEYTGTTPADMEGWGWQSVHDPSVLPHVLRRWRASIDTAQPFEMTFPLRGADGVYRPFLTRVVPLKDSNNVVLRWFGTNTEIGEQLRIMTALQESEQRFRTATDAISGVLWTNDGNGEMKGEQPAWAAFTGQTAEEYGGYGWSKAVHPDDALPTIEAWQEAVRERRLFAFEHRVLRHDGEYRLCAIRALPILDDDGSVHEWVGIHTDITEIRRADDALRASEQSLRIAATTARLGTWELDLATGQMNTSDICKANYGRPIDQPFNYADLLASIHPEDLPTMQNAVRRSIESGSDYSLEYRIFWLDGSLHWVRTSGSATGGEAGKPARMTGVTLDVTERYQAQAVLLQTEKLAAVGRLASSIAHEINNPLEAITNLLYIARGSNDIAEVHRMLETADQELRRVSIIANQTLRFHKQSSFPKEISCADLFATVISMYEGKLRNSGIRVERRKRAENLVRVYEGDIRQVLHNLIGNSIDAMPTGGRLLIRSRESEDWKTGRRGIVLTIADTGTGMSSDTRARIFDAFFTTKGIGGTGLGLWISAEIMQRHGGAISVRSSQQESHRGTVICLFLPLDGPVSALTPDGM